MDDNRRIDSARTVSTSINTRLLLIILVSIVVILGLAHVLDSSVAHQILEPRSLVVQSWLDFFDLNSEASIGSWFSSGLWLVASVLAFAKGQQVRRQKGAAWHWTGLAAVFLLLSLDDAAMLHERIGNILEEQLTLGGALHWSWVLYGMALVLVVALVFGKFLLTLPRRSLWTFVGAGGLFCAGALGLEMYAANAVSSEDGFLPGFGWSASVLVEESLEMLGVIVAIGELLRLLRLGAAAWEPAPLLAGQPAAS